MATVLSAFNWQNKKKKKKLVCAEKNDGRFRAHDETPALLSSVANCQVGKWRGEKQSVTAVVVPHSLDKEAKPIKSALIKEAPTTVDK